jgi:serine phosphatase RsbU (regulator of sigma subunit)
MQFRQGLGLRFKVLIFVGVFYVATVGTLTFLMIRSNRELLLTQLSERAKAGLTLMEAGIANSLFYKADMWRIDSIMKEAESLPDVEYAYTYDEFGKVAGMGDSKARFANVEEGEKVFAAEEVVVDIKGEILDVYKAMKLGQDRIGGIRLGYNLSPILADMKKLMIKDLLIAFSVLAAGFALIFLFTDRIIGPIERLTVAAKRVEQGDLQHRLSIRRNDEIGALAYAFDHMAEGLMQRETESRKAQEVQARLQKIELEQQVIAKDLEVAGVVQTYMLPKTTTANGPGFKLSAFYRSSMQSGGDWWYWDQSEGGRVRILVGDVTGHGVASAMLTAVISGAYQVFRDVSADEGLVPLFNTMHRALRRICGGEFHITFSALEWDPADGLLKWVTLGSPPIFVIEEGAKWGLLSVAGEPLGDDNFQPKLGQKELKAGGRVLLFTDGLFESMNSARRSFGMKRLLESVEKSRQLSIEEARDCLIQELERFTAGVPFEDDVSYVFADLSRSASVSPKASRV